MNLRTLIELLLVASILTSCYYKITISSEFGFSPEEEFIPMQRLPIDAEQFFAELEKRLGVVTEGE